MIKALQSFINFFISYEQERLPSLVINTNIEDETFWKFHIYHHKYIPSQALRVYMYSIDDA